MQAPAPTRWVGRTETSGHKDGRCRDHRSSAACCRRAVSLPQWCGAFSCSAPQSGQGVCPGNLGPTPDPPHADPMICRHGRRDPCAHSFLASATAYDMMAAKSWCGAAGLEGSKCFCGASQSQGSSHHGIDGGRDGPAPRRSRIAVDQEICRRSPIGLWWISKEFEITVDTIDIAQS
jgi:hypothetical protein